jgi:uroporphyrinogen-III synthase
MRILVFRPQADADRSARAIAARGHEPVVAPLFTIVPSGKPAPDGAFAAIVLTSGNAVPALTEGPAPWRELPVFTVGARTAAKAREAGFADARSADGDRNDLIELISRNITAPARLLLIVGRDRHEDIPPRLTEAGYEVVLWEAYAAEAITLLPKAAGKAIAEGEVDAALHYSQRGAETFLTLTRAVSLTDEALALTHVAISADVAGPLIAAGASTVLVAEYPEEAGLLAALDQVSLRLRQESAPDNAPHAATVDMVQDEPVPSPEATRPESARKRSGRTPPTIELAAQEAAPTPAPPAADEPAALLPTEAVPEEFSAPDPKPGLGAELPPTNATGARPIEEPREKDRLPWRALAAAGLVGGVIGAGLMLLGWSRATPAVDPTQIAELRSRIDALQTAAGAADRRAAAASEAAGKAGAEAQALSTRLADLAKVQSANQSATATDAGALAGLNQRLDQAAQRIGSVETLAKTAAAPSPQALAAARIVLAERVQVALASGQPFASDVAALAKGGGAAEQLAALNAVAATGAPTREVLLAQFRTQRAMLARELAPAATGWQDRLLALASRVVTIRPVGDAGGTDPATLPLRLENALSTGNMVAAAGLWAQLPEPARRAGADFGANLQKRAAADAAIAKIAQDAVAALGAAG